MSFFIFSDYIDNVAAKGICCCCMNCFKKENNATPKPADDKDRKAEPDTGKKEDIANLNFLDEYKYKDGTFSLTLDEKIDLKAEDVADIIDKFTDGEACFCGADEIDDSTGPVMRTKTCQHEYHKKCLETWLKQKPCCPNCMISFGKRIGKGPKHGKMTWEKVSGQIPGEECDHYVRVRFEMPSVEDADLFEARKMGKTDEDGNVTTVFSAKDAKWVEKMGQKYSGQTQTGYLPYTEKGLTLLELYKIAFKRRSMFSLGDSLTAMAPFLVDIDENRKDTDGVLHKTDETRKIPMIWPTFNIHMKTSRNGGDSKHGYPSTNWFATYVDECKTNDVTYKDFDDDLMLMFKKTKFGAAEWKRMKLQGNNSWH